MRFTPALALLAAATLLPQAALAQHAQTAPALATIESRTPEVVMVRPAPGRRADFDAMVSNHARANGVPETLVHRVIVRESKYQPHLIGRGGTIGLMQIKLGTARGLGYTGTAEGLRDPETNLTWAVKYLAGAWRIAEGSQDRAVSHYARGYYYAAKQHRLRGMQSPTPTLVQTPAQDETQALALGQPQAIYKPRARRSRDKTQATVPRPDELTAAAPAIKAQ